MTLSPGAAALWSLILPGLAHFRMGHASRAVLAFATTVGLFWAGYAIVGVRLWRFTLFEPFAVLEVLFRYLPLQLLPESPNLGCCFVAAMLRGTADHDFQRLIRMPVEGEHLGLFLTGASGIVACLWAADAHWLARGRAGGRASPGVAALASWFLPGAGHALAGQRGKGLLFAGAVVAVFAMGLLFSHGHAIDRAQNPASFIGDVLFGSGALLASLVTAPWEYAGIPDGFDLGIALCTVAGFMNLIVIVDAYTVAEAAAEAAP
jgi:hypothetical protein